jgi:dihydroneopterin aldolase
VGDEERSRTQEVRFDLVLEFHEHPRATESDRIDDTICYDELTQVIGRVCEQKSYHLIEHLGQVAYDALKERAIGADLLLQVTKLKPPIPGLMGGVTFSLGDRRLRTHP